jgi:hypothetical protein
MPAFFPIVQPAVEKGFSLLSIIPAQAEIVSPTCYGIRLSANSAPLREIASVVMHQYKERLSKEALFVLNVMKFSGSLGTYAHFDLRSPWGFR